MMKSLLLVHKFLLHTLLEQMILQDNRNLVGKYLQYHLDNQQGLEQYYQLRNSILHHIPYHKYFLTFLIHHNNTQVSSRHKLKIKLKLTIVQQGREQVL